MSQQRDLFGAGPVLPEGLRYQPDFIGLEEEAELVATLAALDLQPFQFQGFEGRRRVVYFGLRYDFNAGRVEEAEPIPAFLSPLSRRAEAFAGLAPGSFRHVLVNEYRPGAPIGWHRDRPQFEDVVGVSLGAPARFRFRRKDGATWRRAEIIVEPRSAYLLRGPSRWDWEHSLPPAQALRYSITFRSLSLATRGEGKA